MTVVSVDGFSTVWLMPGPVILMLVRLAPVVAVARILICAELRFCSVSPSKVLTPVALVGTGKVGAQLVGTEKVTVWVLVPMNCTPPWDGSPTVVWIVIVAVALSEFGALSAQLLVSDAGTIAFRIPPPLTVFL